MKKKIAFILLILLFLNFEYSKAQKKDVFENFKQEIFEFQGHTVLIVFPKKMNANKNWIWRARFWATAPQVDLALLEKGFPIVFIDVSGYYGNQVAVKLWCDFYDFMLEKYNLNSKVVLEGMSRGSLIMYNWASQNTDKIACIYADAPVCDIRSWPGGQGKGVGSEMDWYFLLKLFQLNEETVVNFKYNPTDICQKIAKAKIPVLHVCGDSDKYVPIEENTLMFEKAFKKAGGEMKIIIKKDAGHHPHGLEDSKPIIDFILENI